MVHLDDEMAVNFLIFLNGGSVIGVEITVYSL